MIVVVALVVRGLGRFDRRVARSLFGDPHGDPHRHTAY